MPADRTYRGEIEKRRETEIIKQAFAAAIIEEVMS